MKWKIQLNSINKNKMDMNNQKIKNHTGLAISSGLTFSGVANPHSSAVDELSG